MKRTRKPGGGRKPKPAASRKAAMITARIPMHVRKDLERAARASRVTLSVEIGNRLRRSFTQRPDVFGDAQTRAFALAVARLATWVQYFSGVPSWLDNPFVFEAVAAGVNQLLKQPSIKPGGSVHAPDRAKWRMEEMGADCSPQTVGLFAALGVLHELSGPEGGERPLGAIRVMKETLGEPGVRDEADDWNEDLPRVGTLLLRRKQGKEGL